MLSKGQLAVIHVAKKELCLDEETYRDVLEAHAGVRSAKDMDYHGYLQVMGHFQRAGFRRRDEGGRIKDEGKAPRPGMATEAQLKKIRLMWLQLAGSYYAPGQEWKALRGFLKKRFRVEHENFLPFGKAGMVIEAIKAISQREQGKKKDLTQSTQRSQRKK